jgi:2,4-dienoyl-CoA reductase-like NADH-dependent reductase (Old Yellow Enzyme family)/thioredoxin reductase
MPHFVPDTALSTFDKDTILPGSFAIDDPHCQTYLSQLAEAIHFYGGKASMQIGGYVPIKYDVSTGILNLKIVAACTPRTGEEIPANVLEEVAEDFVHQAVILKQCGFDMVYLHMSYRLTILGRLLSPLTNKRTDQYGGSLENQARFPIMVADMIKQACGRDFIIEASLSGYEPEGGRTLEETIKLAKLLAGHMDILQIRTSEMDPAHPAGFTLEPRPFLPLAEAIKKSNPGIAVSTVGGYLDADANEDIVASGKADFVAMARGLISNPDYGKLLYEGRGDDVVPCIRCNMCVGRSPSDPYTQVCSVNPIWGLEHKIERMIEQPVAKKKVAVIGGGPAGMKAALVAADRGHNVTLYEKSNVLGGLLNTTNNVSFKWPQKEFKDWLIYQVNKARVEVILNTDPAPEMLKEKEYDAILVAVGSEPIIPPIPGADSKNVISAPDVYGKEDTLAKSVVIIGGGEVGIETGMHLAQKGHDVTLIEMLDKLAPNAPPNHFYSMFRDTWESLPNLKCITGARCDSIEDGKVTYTNADGKKQTVEAGSVIMSVGMKSKNDLVMKYVSAARMVIDIGDCNVTGNVQSAIRSAFSIASML